MSTPIEARRIDAHAPASCSTPACSEPAVVRVNAEDDETRMSATVPLCREHARRIARGILQVVHGVEHLPPKALPASQRGFVG